MIIKVERRREREIEKEKGGKVFYHKGTKEKREREGERERDESFS